MSDPLAGLEDIRWRDLRHAYGAATDTPGLLQRVAQGTVDDETWQALFSSLAHQGTVYSASAVVAPFLIALTHTVQGRDLQGVLELLEPIAEGGAQNETTSQACVRAAEAGFDRYVELLGHEDARVRALAAQIVACFPARARDSRASFETAVAAETDPTARVTLLGKYVGFAPHDDPHVRERLGELLDDSDFAVAALAAFGLAKGPGGEEADSRRWCDLLVRELANPQGVLPAVNTREILRDLPTSLHAPFFESLLSGAKRAENRARAFDLGHSILWLAFHHRLGGPGRKPRPFVFVESTRFPMPCGTGGGHPQTLERLPWEIHWRDARDRPPGAEWTCSPYLKTWDFPRPGYWSEPPSQDPFGGVGINIAESVDRASLVHDERRALEALAEWDGFWRTDSDLPMVYGLPAGRRQLAALVDVSDSSGNSSTRPWWRVW